ncbi:hypothetical protein JL720_9506 [Aureococcus anophagefferens]|nr:hypothetical protein JL720_9506 [Aureococcus anophagefferens]
MAPPAPGAIEDSSPLLRPEAAVAPPAPAFQRHWRKAVALGLVLGAAVVVLGVVLAVDARDASSSSDDDAASDLSLSFETEGYGTVRSNDEGIYPWTVVEPFRRTILTAVLGERLENLTRADVNGPAAGAGIAETRWTITKHADGGSKRSGAGEGEKPELAGASIAYEFGVPGASYVVSATVRRKRTRELLASASEVVRCKYVKREIRALSESDRAALFDAYNALYRNRDEAAGVKRYGPDFRSARYFVTKHMDRMTKLGCSAWHSSDVFLTSHLAFNLEFDRALQAVNRTLVNSYWDYTKDDSRYGESWYAESPLFTDDFFGADPDADADAPTKGDGEAHVVATGPFAYTPVWTGGEGAPEHNAFYKLSDANNYNPSPWLQRSSRISGLETKVRLPSCTLVRGTLAAPTLTWLHMMVEDYFHGELHSAIGGAWGSTLDLGCVVDELRRSCEKEIHHNETTDGKYYSSCETVKYVEDFAVNINTFSRAAFFVAHQGDQGATSTEDWYNCPTAAECDNRTATGGGAADCACSSPMIRAEAGNTSVAMAKDFLDEIAVATSLSSHAGTDIVHDVDDDDVIELVDDPLHNATLNVSVGQENFLHVTDDDANTLWVLMADWLAAPPRLGPMAATLAAPNDPIFWVMHNTWERMYHKKFLTPSLAENFLWAWTTTDTCWSFALESVLPFSDLLDEQRTGRKFDGPRRNGTTDYTNQQLLDLFNPANPDLPYVYDSLSWDHCDGSENATSTAEAFDHEVRVAYEDAVGRQPETAPGAWPWAATDDALDEDTRRVLRRGSIYGRLWATIDAARRR